MANKPPEHLSDIEKLYWQKYLDLFALVEAKFPEKGINTLFSRAKALTKEGLNYETALSKTYLGAKERTERRINLLNSCTINSENT